MIGSNTANNFAHHPERKEGTHPMSARFTKATRKKLKLRLALDGPSGSGKSYTLLRFAFALADNISKANGGKPARVAAIDTEHGSLSKYQGDSPDGIPFDFDVLELGSFAPTEYTAAIAEAARAGYDVLVIDSLSHAWTGEGGALELKDKQGGNSFTAWKNITPMHNRMIEAIISAPIHVLASMRSKTEYVLEKDADGRTVPKKVGLAPIQRAGMEYEFDVYASIDHAHIMTVSKSRCSAIQDAIVPKPGASMMNSIWAWLETGEAGALPAGAVKREYASDEAVAKLNEINARLENSPEKTQAMLERAYGVNAFDLLTESQAGDMAEKLGKELERKQKREAAKAGKQQTATAATTAAPTEADKKAAAETAEIIDKPAAPPSAPESGEFRPKRGPTNTEKQRLAELRGMIFASRSITPESHPEECKAAWLEALKPFGVTSVGELPNHSIAKLIEHLEKLHCPFSGGSSASTAAAA